MSPDDDGAAAAERAAANAAYRRAMPLQRLTGNGMDLADVTALYRRTEAGDEWCTVAAELGATEMERAAAALALAHRRSARDWYLAAAACFRVGQVPLSDDDPRKRELYRRLVDAYRRAGALSDPPTEHVAIPWRSGTLLGWLLRPPGTDRPPTVIVFGGFDGWREEYHVGAGYLVERGLAVLLVDGPGQGETRLFGGLHLDEDYPAAFSAMVDWIAARPDLGDRTGIWGNSLGGHLAAAVAIADDRIGACCVNGGTATPAEFPERFPRTIDKAQALLGRPDPEPALATLRSMALTAERLANLRCPLLVLHGTPDQVFLVENARRLFDGAGSADKTWREWPDGDHCLYNHSLEKHTLVADWFHDRLDPATHP